uniref:Minor capsid protein n=1 Tax=Gokushovirinae environmental samples TaxID=1478972 RepID=A0A2R3UAL1_9VIRU|nr:minor capsid protein [Gokushovirinae environmental samples]
MIPFADTILNDYLAQGRQEDAQNFNMQQASVNRDWQTQMSNTAVQRHVADLQAAGLNPLLAANGAQASTPSGTTASTAPISPHTSIAQGAATASQIAVNDATADKLKAEAENIREATPTHEVDRRERESRIPLNNEQVKNIHQQITESVVRIDKIWAEAQQATSSAKHLDQQITNLRASLPLIKAQIQNLQALSGQASAATEETKQRIRANLPDLQRILSNLEAAHKRATAPGDANRQAAAESYFGQLGAYLNEINPLKGFLK